MDEIATENERFLPHSVVVRQTVIGVVSLDDINPPNPNTGDQPSRPDNVRKKKEIVVTIFSNWVDLNIQRIGCILHRIGSTKLPSSVTISSSSKSQKKK